MSKHTPPPWKLVLRPGRGYFEIQDNDDAIICKTNSWDEKFADEESANARLIAAAPDLLKAVENMIADLKLRAEIDSRGYKVLNISDGVLMRAEKAIAKAKGEL